MWQKQGTRARYVTLSAPVSVNMEAVSTWITGMTILQLLMFLSHHSLVQVRYVHHHTTAMVNTSHMLSDVRKSMLNYRMQKPNVLTPLLMMRSPRCQMMLHRRDKLLLSCNYQTRLGLLTHYSLSVECLYLMFELWFILTSEPRYLFSNDIHFQCDTHWSSYSMT